MQILPIAASGHPPTGLRILVAEDGLVDQRLARGLLRQCDCCLTIVSDGREVLGFLQNHVFDVILMDVDMPSMDGLTVARTIRSLEAKTGRHIPIIAVTSRDNADECLHAGMDAHLSKPLELLRLCRTLEGVLGMNLRPVDA